MNPIEPRKLLAMPPEEVLKFWPSLELDIWIFEKVLQGPFDVVVETHGTGIIPQFSRRFGDCYALLIMAIMSCPKLEISADEGSFVGAVKAGQLLRKNEIRMWSIKDGPFVGYGRTFPEAICKFMICRTYNIKDAK